MTFSSGIRFLHGSKVFIYLWEITIWRSIYVLTCTVIQQLLERLVE